MTKLNKVALFFCINSTFLGGCTTVGQIVNTPISNEKEIDVTDESLFSSARDLDSEGITMVLAFSGGGTRASALSYGVMEELRDTTVLIKGKPVRLLDEVDVISAVSGGSFTAAYYGLFRDRLFVDYKRKMLTRKFSDQLLRAIFNPVSWFSTLGRTDYASEIYADAGFGDATFSDMFKNGAPLIAINATDLSQGLRFTFLQEYFNLICSDMANFPVSRAVAASAAVPILFNPVVLENYANCEPRDLNNYILARTEDGTVSLKNAAKAALSYNNKQERPYVHLIDGGIADNLGLRMLLESVEFFGGMKEFFDIAHQGEPYLPARNLVIIVVNASVKADMDIDAFASPPSITQTINAVTDAQLHLYNSETLEWAQLVLDKWSSEMSTPERPVAGHLVVVDLQSVEPESLNRRINLIPTTLGLPENDVDLLIDTGRRLLKSNAEYQRLMQHLTSD